MSGHTPEPWEHCSTPDHHVRAVGRTSTLLLLSNIIGERRVSDLKRVVACVNGCKGIQNPEKTVPKLVEALEWAMEKTNPSPCRCMPFARPPHVCLAHRALAEANNPEVKG